MPDVNVNITYDPTQTPKFAFDPDSAVASTGGNEIYWILHFKNLPAGQRAVFDPEEGIIFKDASCWPGGTPGPKGNSVTVWTAEDDVASGSGDTLYPYTTNIQIVDQNGVEVGSDSYDPDIENKGQ